MLLIDSRVWLLGIICCLLGGGIRAEEFAVIKGKIGGKVPAREVQLMIVENGGLSNNKMLFSPFFVLREYIFSFQ